MQARESGTIGRRGAILGGAAALLAGGGAALEGPRVYRHFAQDSLGESVSVPEDAVPVRALSFRCHARASEVQVRIVSAPMKHSSRGVPVCVWLHGRAVRATTMVDELRLPNYLHSAIAGGIPPFVVVAADGGDRYWHARSNGDNPEMMVVNELPGAFD